MKKKIRIGVPRAFLYYRNYILWKSFFEGIGCNIVLSPYTNNDIIEKGKKLSVDESCLPFKIYMGHIYYLQDKCDYILIPRVSNYGKGKRVCVKFNGIYDVVKNVFPDIEVLNYDIDYLKGKFEIFQYIKMGFKINKNILKVIYAYFRGKYKERKHNEAIINTQLNILKSDKLKILIVSHPYIIYDSYLGSNIVSYLKEEGIEIIYADRLERKEAVLYAKEFSKTLYWEYSKEIVGSAFYYKEAVDGIIFVSSFPCGPDSLVNELAIKKLRDTPVINIVLDESSATSGLMTRLESFVDIIKARRDNG